MLSPTFSNVSTDLAGPFRIKNRERKTWILILNMISPPLQGLFFQGESLGVLPLAKCTHNKLLQDVYHKSGKEVLSNSHSTLHTLAVKAHGVSSKSELVVHKLVTSGLLSCLGLKQGAVSTLNSG